ncbi:MAG TPA: CAP domain-containing protein, partial [Gemmataceae bacterium]
MFPFYRPAGCKLWVELLEDRNAPAATAVLTEGVLDVRGGDGPDTISLRAQGGLLTVPEAGASFPADAVRLVSVLAGPGDDVVSVAPEVAAPVWLFGGPGDDTLTGGGGADQFYGGDGDDVLDGGPGDDTLFGGRGADVLSDLRGTNAVSQGLPSRTVENTAAEARLIEQTNAARQAAGLAPLRVSAALNAAAAFHAGRMAALAPALGAGAVFEHDLPGSPAPVLTARIDYAGYDSAYVAENLVMGAGLGDAVVGLWMGSPVHRANIVNPALTEVGLAAREGPDGAVFYVQVFGTPRPPEGGLPAGLIAAGPGPGAVPVVALFDGRGNPAGSLPAFGEGARGGVRVAAADVTGDGVPDVIAAPGPGVPS